ncbi:MAG: NAD-dependent epimerase/dehydratase family protein [Myxococcota bacterium]|nr:NAD-dependent epimerase/dehydratase family protein [Myxococcota bacterium]
MKILITGISGAIGQLLCHQLLTQGHEVIGLDRREWTDAPPGVRVFLADIRKRPAEDVLRTQRPQALIHLATTALYEERAKYLPRRRERILDEQCRINLGGTRTLLEYCAEYGVERFVFVGRHTVYGASHDSPLYHTEDEPPLAVASFPELADLCAADLFAASALWRWPQMSTAILRVVYPLGPSRRGTMASFLRSGRVPTVLGYDPLFQFMHEEDVARAISTAVEAGLRGLFNVAGPAPLPLSLICKELKILALPIPEPLYPHVLGRFGFPRLPDTDLAHLKYPVVVDDSLFRASTGFAPRFDEGQTLQAFVGTRNEERGTR